MPWLPVVHTPEEDIWFYSNIVLPEQRVEIAELKGQIVGFSALDDQWLNHLYLDPRAQRRGIGSLLLISAMQSQIELNLWVFERNRTAQKFYSSRGFTEIARTDGSKNEEKTPDIHMRWVNL